MLGWILTFLVLALVAGALGFSGLAGASANIAWFLVWLFLALMIVSAVVGVFRGQRPPI